MNLHAYLHVLIMLFRNNMGGSTEWDNRMMDSLKNFDLNSPDVKQQFGKCKAFVDVFKCLVSMGTSIFFLYILAFLLYT